MSGTAGYRHTIDGGTVRHILDEHGDPKTEELRGQIAVTREDIAHIPEILRTADEVEPGGEKRGLSRVLYRKREDGATYIVEEARTGAEELATVTMYKKKKWRLRGVGCY